MRSNQSCWSSDLNFQLRPPQQRSSSSSKGRRIDRGQFAASHARVSVRNVSRSVIALSCSSHLDPEQTYPPLDPGSHCASLMRPEKWVRHRNHVIVAPPSMTMDCPVMKVPACDARKTAAPAISSGSPMRPSGVREVARFRLSGSSQSARAKSVRMRPGAMQLIAHVVRTELDGEIARQLEVRRLGNAVGADDRVAAQPADRRHDDDRAVLARDHLRRQANWISQWLEMMLLSRILRNCSSLMVRSAGRNRDWTRHCRPGHRSCRSRLLVSSTRCFRSLLRRNIRGDGDRAAFAVLGLDRVGHLLARTRLARRDDDFRAVLCHPLDDGAADAARRAGDDGDLAGRDRTSDRATSRILARFWRRTLASRAPRKQAQAPVWSSERHGAMRPATRTQGSDHGRHQFRNRSHPRRRHRRAHGQFAAGQRTVRGRARRPPRRHASSRRPIPNGQGDRADLWRAHLHRRCRYFRIRQAAAAAHRCPRRKPRSRRRRSRSLQRFTEPRSAAASSSR